MFEVLFKAIQSWHSKSRVKSAFFVKTTLKCQTFKSLLKAYYNLLCRSASAFPYIVYFKDGKFLWTLHDFVIWVVINSSYLVVK